jgi:hypothetical protein
LDVSVSSEYFAFEIALCDFELTVFEAYLLSNSLQGGGFALHTLELAVFKTQLLNKKFQRGCFTLRSL